MRYQVRSLVEPESSVATVKELDALLDRVAAVPGESGAGHEVWVFNWVGGKFLGVQLGVGHPDRSFVHFNDASEQVFGYQPDVGYAAGYLAFDQVVGSSPLRHPPALTRVTPAAARLAAREFVTTGQRPTCLSWEPSTFWSWFTEDELRDLEQWHDGIQY
jgi:hypothetical protein